MSLPSPDSVALAHSEKLRSELQAEIARGGAMPFSRYMSQCLYAPGLGYYSAGAAKFGAVGDFVTAPELGSVFARALALAIQPLLAADSKAQIVELGAGSGQLAVAILQALAGYGLRPQYCIFDVSADLRQRQRNLLEQAALLQQVSWLDQPPAEPWSGVLLANEVIDALPVEAFEIGPDGSPLRRAVGYDPEQGLHWTHCEWQDNLLQVLEQRLEGLSLASGYRSELLPYPQAWLRSLTSTLRQGLALFVDYGFPRHEYYLPERSEGTLMCHYRHHADGNPLQWPGLKDITASVDFTALAEAGVAEGFSLQCYTTQARFLLASDLPQLLAGSESLPEPQRLRLMSEIKQLMLPQAMGERFQLMALGRGDLPDLALFAAPDLRRRL